MQHCGTQTLETADLILRKFTLADDIAMYENWVTDPEVTRYLTWTPHTDIRMTQAILKDWVNSYQNDNYYQWAIVPKNNNNRPIGSIGVVRMNEETASMTVGYCIGKQWWHKGFTSQALTRMIAFLFENTDVNRIGAYHDSENFNSGKVMKKSGMTYEGTLRQFSKTHRDICCDICCYSILRTEYIHRK